MCTILDQRITTLAVSLTLSRFVKNIQGLFKIIVFHRRYEI